MYEIVNFIASVSVGAQLPVDSAQFRQSVLALQDELSKLPQIGPPLQHHFAAGSYAREMLIPAGSLIIGKIHRHSHINVISQGRIYVATEFGHEILEAPLTFVSKPGTKRAVYALTDVRWTTVHVTDETDLARIESEVIAPDYETFEADQRLFK